MDWSPILSSMKTAGLSIVVTFFLGILAAWLVVSVENGSGRDSDLAAGASAYGGRLLSSVSVWSEEAPGAVFSGIFQR